MPMVLDASKFRNYLNLQTLTTAKSDLGQSVQTMTTTDNMWGSITQLHGDEILALPQIYAEATHLIQCRDPGYAIEESMRFLFTDVHGNLRIFNILTAKTIQERAFFYHIIVKELLGGV
jgi:SPP1 family predicted phage head-tail adaptor